MLLSILPFVLLNAVSGQDGLDQWWYDLGGHDSPASDYLAATSPFYSWFKNAQEQFDAYAPAKHVGKINRGSFLNPELNLPADRAFGHNSDFNVGDLTSGAFSYAPQTQKFVAKKVHVDAGLARKVGQIANMPAGIFVQDDGSVLIDTGRVGDPCNPSPCPAMGTPRCVPVSSTTAKCIGPDSKTLELKWSDPVDEPTASSQLQTADLEYDLDLILVPSKNYDSSACSDPKLTPGDSECGATVSADDKAKVTVGDRGTETAELKTLTDGTTFKDYTYAVIAQRITASPNTAQIPDSDYNLAYAGLKLNFYSDLNGVRLPEFVYTVPQGDVINTANKDHFFFGCVRLNVIHLRALDTRGAGFYNTGDDVRGTGYNILDSELCDSLKNLVPAITPGFQ